MTDRRESILVDTDEAAELLGVSPRMIRKLTEQGQIQSLKIGRARRYDVADLRAFIDRQKAAS